MLSAKFPAQNLFFGPSANKQELLHASILAVLGPYTEQALYHGEVMFLVFNDRFCFSKTIEITAHADSSKDDNYVKVVATIKLIETCVCAVLIEVTRVHFAA